MQSNGTNNWARVAWMAGLVCFILAGLTGTLFRFGLTGAGTWGLELSNVRHAHSHMMYFGWVTPLLMAFISRELRWEGPWPRYLVVTAFVCAALAYAPFLLYGYTPAVFGGRRLPLSVMAAGLNVIAWYGFALLYALKTRGVDRSTGPIMFWDLSVTLLILSTMGAWGLALAKPLGISSVTVTAGLTHFFLDLFSEGWFVLGVFGLMMSGIGAETVRRLKIPLVMVGLGTPVLFAFGMSEALLSPQLRVLARIGAALVGAGTLWLLAVSHGFAPRAGFTARILLGLKALAQLAAALIPGMWVASDPGSRVLYLHLMLLGFVTLGLYTYAEREGFIAGWGRTSMQVAVLILIASLLPLTRWWPEMFVGLWRFRIAAWITFIPVFTAAVVLLSGPPPLSSRKVD